MNTTIIETANRTIALEAKAIASLSNFIDSHFEKVVHAIHQCVGRVVISGIGKSAIVAQKIVATLNSTGTPSLFMHAADAIHGDLGMIQPQDIVILISKSGESPEIKVLVPLIKNFKNLLVALVGNVESFLAKEADFIINTTIDQEACPNNLAPTSSTTAQMVMGDALAVCLMELKQFSNTDFARFHPGGNLGKRLYLSVKDIAGGNPIPKVLPTASLKEVIMEITAKRLGATAVVDSANHILGIITDGDLRRMLERSDSIKDITAAHIYTPHPKTIPSFTLAVDALDQFSIYGISHLLVEADGKYIGIVHLHDLIKEGIA